MLLVTDDPRAATAPAPEALIEEARQHQRQRSRRRRIALAIAAVLAILGSGIDQLAQGGGGNATPQAAAVPAAQAPTVTYEKIVVLKIVPELPVEKRTIEAWSASSAPSTFREVVTIAGGPRLEIGTTPGSGKVLGPEQVNFLYDRSSNTIFRTGVMLPPAQPARTPQQVFRRTLAEPGVRVAGSRTYRGRSVFVLAFENRDVTGTVYIDKSTYEPMMSDERGTDLHSIVRTLVYKTLPPTKENLALASLRTAHPHARVVLNASPHIKALFGEAAFPSGDYGSG